MKALNTAIYSKFTASGISLPGGFHRIDAPIGTNTPYAVFRSYGHPEYTFTSVKEYFVVTIDIYADLSSKTQDLQLLLEALFDDCVLTVSGYRFVKMEREYNAEIKDTDYYHAIIQYRVEIEK